jgi:hypothetical protein
LFTIERLILEKNMKNSKISLPPLNFIQIEVRVLTPRLGC